MDRILLVTRPKYDDATEYLSFYASLVIKNAISKGVKIKDFEGNTATHNNIKRYISKMNPKLLFINGHGDEVSIEGDKGEILFSIKEGLELLKNKIIYARACYAGIKFGREVVKDNEGCFIGYNLPFSFIIDEKWSAIPSNDKTAALFLEPSNEIVYSLIKGNDTKIADEKSKRMMTENMKKILRMEEKKEPGAMALLQVMWNNYEGQVLHGNQNISF